MFQKAAWAGQGTIGKPSHSRLTSPESPKETTMESAKSDKSESKRFSIVGAEVLEDEIGPVIRDERQAFLYAAAEHPEIRLAESLRSTVHSKLAALPPTHWLE